MRRPVSCTVFIVTDRGSHLSGWDHLPGKRNGFSFTQQGFIRDALMRDKRHLVSDNCTTHRHKSNLNFGYNKQIILIIVIIESYALGEEGCVISHLHTNFCVLLNSARLLMCVESASFKTMSFPLFCPGGSRRAHISDYMQSLLTSDLFR